MHRLPGMCALQRPPTIREFVIRSILGAREPAPTLVDREDEAPTAVLSRGAFEDELPPVRASQASIVFDLSGGSELVRDTLPSPPPSVPDAW